MILTRKQFIRLSEVEQLIGMAKLGPLRLFLVRWKHNQKYNPSWEAGQQLKHFGKQKNHIKSLCGSNQLFIIEKFKIQCVKQIKLIEQKEYDKVPMRKRNVWYGNKFIEKVIKKQSRFDSIFYLLKWELIEQPEWVCTSSSPTIQHLINSFKESCRNKGLPFIEECQDLQDPQFQHFSNSKQKLRVEKIVGKKWYDNTIYYLAKWKQQFPEKLTWIHRQDYTGNTHNLIKFNKSISGKQLPFFQPNYQYLRQKNLDILLKKKHQASPWRNRVTIVGKRKQNKRIFYLIMLQKHEFQWISWKQTNKSMRKSITKFNQEIKDQILPYLDPQFVNQINQFFNLNSPSNKKQKLKINSIISS